MSIKCKAIGLVAALVFLLSCGGKTTTSNIPDQGESDEMELSTLDDTEDVAEEEEELDIDEKANPAIDGVFNDFLFAYLHSRSLRSERTDKPLQLEHTTRPTEMLEEFDPVFEFGFLSGEYFTTLYGNIVQMHDEDEEEQESDSAVNVQRINLNDGTIRNFLFQKEQEHWRLTTIREATFGDDDLGDFLSFYAQFSTDSLFQTQAIADPLHIVIRDYEDEDSSIDGIIDADQWQTFCSEVPSGIISNIRKSQSYGGHRIVLRKSGLSNGLQEVFTFTKEKGNWRLTKYEN